MAANETTIEAHIGFLRSDLSDVKQDVRKLTADSTTIQTTLRDKIDQSHAALSASQAALSDRMNRGFETLSARIDAGDRELRERIDAVEERLGDKIDAVNQDLGNRIDAVNKDLGDRIVAVDNRLSVVDNRLGQKIDAVEQRLGDKIDAVDKRLGGRIDALGSKIDHLGIAFAELRGFHKTVLWVCGGVVTVVTVALSVGKAFGWF